MAYIYNTQCVGLFSTAAAVRCVTGCGVWWHQPGGAARGERGLSLSYSPARARRARAQSYSSRDLRYICTFTRISSKTLS